VKAWDEQQLQFTLELDEVAEDAKERLISPQEARQISEAALRALQDRFKTPRLEDGSICTWMQDYLDLRSKGWPWRVAAYIAWASSPKEGRWPETLTDLATQVLDLASPRVIYTWRKKYQTIDNVVGMMQTAPLWEHRRAVIDALVKVASMPDYKGHQDRKLYLTLTGDFVDKRELDLGNSVKDELLKMTDAELRAGMGEIMSEDEEDESEDIQEETDGDDSNVDSISDA